MHLSVSQDYNSLKDYLGGILDFCFTPKKNILSVENVGMHMYIYLCSYNPIPYIILRLQNKHPRLSRRELFMTYIVYTCTTTTAHSSSYDATLSVDHVPAVR